MKYFKISQETDSKIIGKYPQVKELKIDFHEARASQWGKISSWQTNDDIPDLNNFVLHYNSRLSDCVSNNYVQATSGLFISEKCHQVFESFKVNGRFYPMTIFRKGIPHPYYFLWYEYGGKKNINYKSSVFKEYGKREETYGQIVPVEDAEDYKIKFRKFLDEKEGWGWDIVPTTLSLYSYFDITPAFGVGLMCNENVKNAIEENQLTGFQFRPVGVEIQFEA